MFNRFVVNAAGLAGYLASGLGWLWSVALLLISVSWLEDMAPTPNPNPTVDLIPTIELSASSSEVVGLVVVAVMVLISIYVVLRLPIVASRTTSKATRQAADKIVSVTTTKKPLKPVERQRLSSRVRLYIKFSLALLPTIVTTVLIMWPNLRLELATDIALLISACLSAVGLVAFVAQQLLARWFKLKPEQLL